MGPPFSFRLAAIRSRGVKGVRKTARRGIYEGYQCGIGERNMKKRIVALLFSVFCVAANATCIQSDLAGTWKVHSIGFTSANGLWGYCTLKLNSSGFPVSGSFCKNSAGTQSNLTGGPITLSSTCRFAGSIKDGGTLNTITDGQLSRDKTTLSGAGRVSGGVFIFTGVKQ